MFHHIRHIYLVVAVFVLLTLTAVVAIEAEQGGSMTADYYGKTIDYNQLVAEKAKTGDFVQCVARPPSSPKSTDVILDCFDTVEEANQKLFEYRPDLRAVMTDAPANRKLRAPSLSSRTQLPNDKALLACSSNITLFYNAGYSGAIPGLTNICTSVSYANVNFYSDWINGTACVRLWQFPYYSGNSTVLCNTYWYFYWGLGSMQWLG